MGLYIGGVPYEDYMLSHDNDSDKAGNSQNSYEDIKEVAGRVFGLRDGKWTEIPPQKPDFDSMLQQALMQQMIGNSTKNRGLF